MDVLDPPDMGEVMQLVGNCRSIDATDNVLNASQASLSNLSVLIADQYNVPIVSSDVRFRKTGRKSSNPVGPPRALATDTAPPQQLRAALYP